MYGYEWGNEGKEEEMERREGNIRKWNERVNELWNNIDMTMLLLLYLIANFACYGVGQNKTFVPDALAGCYPIDTQEQIFFDTVEELAAAKAAEQRAYMKKR